LTEHATAGSGRASGAEHPAAPLGSRQAHREASERDKRARRFLLRLSLINWGIAVVAWSISAFLGITSPASIIVYSVLFVIGLIAVIVALLTYLLEKFAHRPPDYEHADLEDDAGKTVVAATAVAGGAAAAAKTEAPAAAKAEPPAAPKAESAERKPAAPAAEAEPAAPAKERKPADAPRRGAARGDGKAVADGDAPAAPKG
jgi:hypothetical protein